MRGVGWVVLEACSDGTEGMTMDPIYKSTSKSLEILKYSIKSYFKNKYQK